MDIKKLDNIEQGLLTLQNIKSTDNAADTKTKLLTKHLFYPHVDTIMGGRLPRHLL
jgi:hypothetical protein